WELSFLGNFSQNSYQFTPTERETTFGTFNISQVFKVYFDGWEKDLFRTYFGAFTLNYKPNKDLKLSFLTSAYHTNENETYDIGSSYILSEKKQEMEQTSEGEVLGIGQYAEHARNTLNATVANISHLGEYSTSHNKINWGITAQIEQIADKISEWKWTDSVGYSLPYDTENFNLYYSLKSKNNLQSFRAMAYVQDTYKWTTAAGRWTFIGGVRSNYWNLNNEILVSPRALIALSPAWKQDFSFRFATGMYYQAPFYKELRQIVQDEFGVYNVLLNKDLRAQRSLHAVLGGDYYFKAWGREFKFTTEAYLKYADRVVSYQIENVNVRYSGINDAKAYTAGIDFKLFGELVPGAETWINFSLMDSKEQIIGKTFVIDKKQHTWIPRPNSQRYVFSMLFQDYLPNNPKYRLHLRAIFADGMPFSSPNNEQYRAAFHAPSYRRVDIGASRVWERGKDKLLDTKWLGALKKLQLNVEVFNLLNIDNVNSYYWITNIYAEQMAVPNYLTGRMLNLKLMVDF
ncbi:MAG: TonB-dependent receptor, partial [Prevotellaceae bacterium]|nr:TonB-dependent receptor [Prevotellaceae bacterium]